MQLFRKACWLVVWGLAVGCSPAPDQRGGGNFQLPQDRYATVNGIQLHYLDWGGDGDLLLLIPGLSHTAYSYGAVAPALTDRFRVIGVTRRDHGASEKVGGRVDLDVLVDDLVDFIDLFGDRPVVVVGQSYAGLEMPRLARRLPRTVRALVFLDAVYDWTGWVEQGPPFPGYFNARRSYASHAELESWFEKLYPEIWSPASRAHLISQTYLGSNGNVHWHFPVDGPHWSRYLEVEKSWNPAEYEGLDLPILSIQVEQGGFMVKNLARAGAPAAVADTARRWADDLDNVLKRRGREALAAAAPHARMVQYEDTHHWLHLQSPDRVAREITAFLDEEVGR